MREDERDERTCGVGAGDVGEWQSYGFGGSAKGNTVRVTFPLAD